MDNVTIQKVKFLNGGGLSVEYKEEKGGVEILHAIECHMFPKKEVRDVAANLAMHLGVMWEFITAKSYKKEVTDLSAIELNKMKKVKSDIAWVSVTGSEFGDERAVVLGGKRTFFNKKKVPCNSSNILESTKKYPLVVDLWENVDALCEEVKRYVAGEYDTSGDLFGGENVPGEGATLEELEEVLGV